MAIQDQQQDSVLKRIISPLALLALLCGIGSGGVVIFKLCTSPNDPLRDFSGNSHSFSQISATNRVSLTAPFGATRPERNTELPSPHISPGLPPSSNLLTSYSPLSIEARIAAVERGSLNGNMFANGPQHKAENNIRTDSPAIGVSGGNVTIHVQRLSAALTLDPLQFPHNVAVLSFPSDELYRIELPMNGAGTIVDGVFIPPGGSEIVGSGSRILVRLSTAIHLRPAEPILPPLGSG